jgi:hypothetical protein
MDGISSRAGWYASAATGALPVVIQKRLRTWRRSRAATQLRRTATSIKAIVR